MQKIQKKPLFGNLSRIIKSAVTGMVGLSITSSVFAATGTDTWTGTAGDNNWATAGNWTGVNAPPAAGDTPAFGAQGAGGLTLNNNLTAATSYLGLTFNAGAPAFTLTGNSLTTTGGIVDNSFSLETITLPIILSGSHSVNAVAGGTMLLDGVISGASAGITKTGGGTVDLNGPAVNTYTGATTVNAGTLLVDFSNVGATANLISSSSALAFGGGTLQINGNVSAATSQKFASTALNAGGSTLSVAGNVNVLPAVALGAFSQAAGGNITINGPASSSGSSTPAGQTGSAGNGDTTGLQPPTATITTTSGSANQVLQSTGSGSAAYYDYATVGGYDFAAVTGSSPFTITGYSQISSSSSGLGTAGDGSYFLAVTGFDSNNGVFQSHFEDVVGNFTASANTTSLGGYRYNFNGGLTTTLAGVQSVCAVLVTPNVGANNTTIAEGASGALQPGLRSSNNGGSLVIYQNNVAGFLILGVTLSDGKTAGGSWVQTGAGTIVYSAANTFTGPLYLEGGVSEIGADSGLGAASTGATVNLNGGTILGKANFTLDNSGSKQRGIALGNNGGSLAAVGGTTMTVDGVIGGSTPLTIGIPVENANGNVAGQVPGTGTGTANASVLATGTVALTGVNTYTGGTILVGGTMSINNTGLGTGGVGFNGGTLQWASGTSNDFSTQVVTINSAGGTLDANGNPVTLANAIGNNGSGALTVQSSVAGGILNLRGSSTYTGDTTVSSGTLNANNPSGSATGTNTVTVLSGAALGGSGTITGTVTWQSGALGSFEIGTRLTAGVVALNNNSVVVNVPGSTPLQPGTYTLMNYNATGSTGSFNTAAPAYTGAGVTPGTFSEISTSGGTVTLTVTAVAGILRTWVGDGVANNWDFTTTNWLNNGNLDNYDDGDLVVFDDTGADSPAINLTTTVQPASLLVNAAQNYTFSGIGQISGATTLVKTNTGTLIIRTANTYSGGTTIGQGTLQLGNGVIAGSLGTNLVQDNGSLVLDQPGSRSFANLVSGTGSLTQAGAGTLTLTASNTYTGGTTISAGTLQLNSGAWLGSGSISDDGTLIFNQSGNATVSAIISGSGALTQSGSGTVTLTGNNTYGGGTIINSGTLLVNNSSGSVGAGTVTVNGGQLGGGGTINGAVVINSGGTLSPGNPVGALTINNSLTANSGATVNFTLGTVSDQVVVNGNLNLSGTLAIAAASGFTTTTYTLITYSGTLALGTVTLNLPAHTMAALDTSTPGQVNLVVQTLSANIPAFPGALGFGQAATGARFGTTVYHVTNTNDSGAGSFRDAVSQVNRFVVFDVGGTIVLQSAVTCQSSLTIAGQTAPGGIAIIGHEVSFSERTNDIVRFLRIRPGSVASSTEDGINMGDATNMIFDHLSLEFAPYNTIDATGGNTGGNQITMQNCILADPIGQQFNAHTEAVGNNFSWFYNIFSSGHDRNPLAKINTIFINNIVYNFQGGYTCANTSGHFSHDIINNYFITGPATSDSADDFFQFDGNQKVYAAGNLLESDQNGTLNDSSSTAPGGGSLVLNSPWSPFTTNTPTYSTTTAYRYVLSTVGASPQDQVDQLVINDVTSLGTAGMGGGLWTSQTQSGLTNNGYGGLVTGTLPMDTDGDGIPDYYEEAMGSNPNVADSLTPGTGGYTKLENYLNWLGALNALTTTNTPVNVDLWQYTAGFTNASPVYSVSNPTNGTVTLISGHIVDFTPKMGFMGLGSFQFAVADHDGSAITNTVTVCVTPLGAVASYAAPMFSAIAVSGNGLAMTGTGGITNANFVLLGSTNVGAPMSQWTSLTTNRFDGNGNFNFTNPATGGLPQSYYLLELP